MWPNRGQADSGERRYAGTLILVTSHDAAGTLTHEFKFTVGDDTFLLDPNSILFPLIATQPETLTTTGP